MSQNTHKVTRRGFLKTAGFAMGAAAFPAIIPASARGADGHIAPSNRLNLGFIGIGKQMHGHIRTFARNPEVQVHSLCDVEMVRRGMRKKEVNEHYAGVFDKANYNGVLEFGDFRDLVARDDIDACVIATPDHWHALTSIAACKAGKDVYCEKPLSLTIGEGKAMVEAARRYGTVFQTGSQQRSSREFRVGCELVRNGRIGKVHTVHVNVGGPPVECHLPAEPTPPGLDWDFWLGPAPYRPYNSDIAPGIDYEGWPNFRSYRDYSGGMMTDWGAHHFDIAQWGLGMDGSGPVEIIPPDGKDHQYLTYKYANGVTMYHGGGSGGRAGVEFIGTEGRVMVNRGYIETDPEPILNEFIGPDDINLYNSPGHHQDWLNCIKTRQRPICDVGIGFSSVTVCHLGNNAYWLKRPLKWDPVALEYVDDAEANRQLIRPMRDPWHV